MKKMDIAAAAIFLILMMPHPMAFAIGLGSIVKDIAVVGPGGEVLVYYKDGNDIVVRNCGKDYPNVKTRSDCATVGQENRVPVAVFKRALESEFQIVDADKLQPLTSDEIQAYRSSDPQKLKQLQDREKELDAKLTRIKTFIDSFGADAKSTQDRDSADALLAAARKELSVSQKGGAAIKKVNALIDGLVDQKIASSEMVPVSSTKAGDQATYTLLKGFDASRPECGTDEILNGTRPSFPAAPGTAPRAGKADAGAWLFDLWVSAAIADTPLGIPQRVKDCSGLPGSTVKTKAGVTWNLVARKRDRSTGKYYEVWHDSNGQVWGDRLDSSYSHRDAVALGLDGKVTQEKACVDAEGKRASAGITGKSFGLPSIEEYQQAEKDGIREVLPNMDHWFWSASLHPNGAVARIINGSSGYSDSVYREYNGCSVRCVGR